MVEHCGGASDGPRAPQIILLLALAFPTLAAAQFGRLPSGSFCGIVDSGEGRLQLNLTFASPCKLRLTGGSTGNGTCDGESYSFDSDACFGKSPSYVNCSVVLPDLKKSSDCFRMQGIRQITFDMVGPGSKPGHTVPQVDIYAFTDSAYHAVLHPCTSAPDARGENGGNHVSRRADRYLLPVPNGTSRPLDYSAGDPVACGIAEQKLCGGAKLKGTDPCLICMGNHVVEIAAAGCTDSNVRNFCGSQPPPPQKGCDGMPCCGHACGSVGTHGCNYLATCGGCSCSKWTNPVPGGVPCDCSC